MADGAISSEAKTPLKRANYGIDAPGVVRNFFFIGIVGCGAAVVASRAGVLTWTHALAWPCGSIGIIFFAQAFVMLWGSKVGKMRLRDRVLESIPWRGDEMVLDVGCGHGLMLIGATKRLRTGRAIGIDLWQQEDQAGNSRDATWQNILAENVSDRVELRDGDARKLPFTDSSFDVILSSWALHNIYDAPGRATAICEIARVLKPGGRAVIVDIRHSAEYARVFESCGLEVTSSGPNYLFVIPSLTVTAKKRI